MLLEPLRRRRDQAYKNMMEFVPVFRRPKQSDLDECMDGTVEAFKDDWYDYDEEEWDSPVHKEFYMACKRVKEAEAEEYKKAMQWA